MYFLSSKKLFYEIVTGVLCEIDQFGNPVCAEQIGSDVNLIAAMAEIGNNGILYLWDAAICSGYHTYETIDEYDEDEDGDTTDYVETWGLDIQYDTWDTPYFFRLIDGDIPSFDLLSFAQGTNIFALGVSVIIMVIDMLT